MRALPVTNNTVAGVGLTETVGVAFVDVGETVGVGVTLVGVGETVFVGVTVSVGVAKIYTG